MKTREFYDGYWRYRKQIGKIHASDGGRIPTRLQLAAQFIEPRDLGCTRILDLGCGEGTLGKILLEARKQCELVGVDVSPVALNIAASFYSKTVCCDLDAELDILKRLELCTFDYIVALEVLERIRYPEALLKTLSSLCKPAATFIFSFPNIAWYGYRKQLLFGRLPQEWFYSTSEHLHYFTLSSFEEMLFKHDFQTKQMAAFFQVPRLFRLLPGTLVRAIESRYPSVFGYQIVLKCRLNREKEGSVRVGSCNSSPE